MKKSNKNKITTIIEQSKPNLPSEKSAIHVGGIVVKESVSAYEKHHPSITQDRHEKGQDDGHTAEHKIIGPKQERKFAKLETRDQLLEAANDLLINGGYPELPNAELDNPEPESKWWYDDQYSLMPSEHLSPKNTTKISVSHDEASVGQAIAVRRLKQSKNRKGTDPISYYDGPYSDQDIVTDIIH